MSETFKTSNYLVPVQGYTRGYTVRRAFTLGQPYSLDFVSVGLDGVGFQPSGIYVDNTRGNGTLTVTIDQTGYTMAIRAGKFFAGQYPAPMNHTVTISGDGEAVIVFVDYPVIPQQSGINAGEDVQVVGAVTVENDEAAPLFVQIAGSAGGALDVQFSDPQPVYFPAAMPVTASGSVSISGGSVSINGGAISIDSPVQIDGPVSISGGAITLVEYDSNGDPIPVDFMYKPRWYTYTATNKVETETLYMEIPQAPGMFAGYRKTYTYDANDNLQSVSAWTQWNGSL